MEKTKKKLSIASVKSMYQDMKNDVQFANDRKRWAANFKKLILGLFKFIILVGVSYVILGPIIGIISSSFFSDADNYNPMVYLIPQEPTLFRYEMAIEYLDYGKTVTTSLFYSLSLMVIQVLVCSMVGYGFARFKFPFKNVLFALVVVMIVIPTHTIMLPLYMTFSKFDIFGIIELIKGNAVNLLATPTPVYIMTIFGCGLRSGIYIYLFNQFFRGLPKEIEDFIYTHPKVLDVQVIGVPDKQYGEEIMACVILKEGETMTEEEMKEYVASHMAKHKTPRYVDFVDGFPMNAAGKILKYKMREQAVEKLNLHAANSIETA